MEILGYILIFIGGAIGLFYGIKLIVLAFQTSVLWGLGYLLVPFVALIFVIMHWSEAGKPFLMSLISIPFFVGGVLLLPQAAATL